jgi:acetyltransferase-like isoleucine patch superfamily enzyme
MPRAIKRLLINVLKPIAGLLKILSPAQRLWAHACLAASVKPAVDTSVVVLGCPEVHGTGHIQLGKNLLLYRELYLETQGTGYIIVGDNVVMSRGVHLIAFERIDIGTDCMIGEYTSIRDANHRFDTSTPIREAGHTSAAITIGKNVWLGRGVTVLAGVTIGDNAVIGANAVVTNDIPANTIAVGIPARPLKSR